MRPNRTALRAIREAQHKSLGELGQQAGIHKAHLWRVEKGLAGVSDEKLHNLAEALAVSIEAITQDDNPQETT